MSGHSMSAVAGSKTSRSRLSGRLGDWWRRRAAARRAQLELDANPQETERIAHDVGLSPAALHELAKHGPEEAELLRRRMAALHLDPEELARRDGGVMQDLQRLCTLCGSKGECAAALDWRPQDASWQNYCPNAGTLNVLQARWPGPAKPSAPQP